MSSAAAAWSAAWVGGRCSHTAASASANKGKSAVLSLRVAQRNQECVRRMLRPHAIRDVHCQSEAGTGEPHFRRRARLLNTPDDQRRDVAAQGAVAADDRLNYPVRPAPDAPSRIAVAQRRLQELHAKRGRNRPELAQGIRLGGIEGSQ